MKPQEFSTKEAAIILIVALLFLAIPVVHSLLLPRYSKVLTQTKPVAYRTTTNNDCSLPVGTSKVTTKGVNGIETIVYKVNYVNNKEKSRQVISDKTTTKPIDEVVDKGVYSASQSALSFDASECQLNCSISTVMSGYLMAQGLTAKQYAAYVQQMQANHCSNIEPYCMFNSTIKCKAAAYGSSVSSDGYVAGYNYAEQYQICDTGYSSGKSTDFNQGVQDWAVANCTGGQPN